MGGGGSDHILASWTKREKDREHWWQPVDQIPIIPHSVVSRRKTSLLSYCCSRIKCLRAFLVSYQKLKAIDHSRNFTFTENREVDFLQYKFRWSWPVDFPVRNKQGLFAQTRQATKITFIEIFNLSLWLSTRNRSQSNMIHFIKDASKTKTEMVKHKVT